MKPGSFGQGQGPSRSPGTSEGGARLGGHLDTLEMPARPRGRAGIRTKTSPACRLIEKAHWTARAGPATVLTVNPQTVEAWMDRDGPTRSIQ